MKKLFLLLVAVLTLSLCASAQTRTVKGTVVDAANDEPLIGVSVTAGTNYGVSTDIDGKFVLQVPASATHLKVSYVGYKTADVKIGSGDMTIRLHADSELLDEVIAVAYGKSTRASFTGSAAVVDAATLENAQVSNPLNALKGKVAGVQMSNASGAPGSDSPTIRIRGISSINAGNDPLVVVDGTPFSGSMNTINTNDIENMTILKDAASTALYGSRGANGVILITTKRAKAGEAKVTVDIKLGSNSRAQQDYNYIKNPAQYYETYFGALKNYSLSQGNSDSQAYVWAVNNMIGSKSYGLQYNVYDVPDGQALIGTNGKLNPNATLGRVINYNNADYYLTTDNWLDAAYHNSLRQEYNVSIAKGGDATNFYLSASYLDNEGITPASGFSRFTGRLAADTQAKSWLKVAGDLSYTHYEQEAYGGEEGSAGSTSNPFAFVSNVAPIYPLFVRDGKGNVKIDNNGFPVYDYGAGNNAGLSRPVLGGNSNAIGSALLDKAETNGNALSATGSAEIRFLNDFTITSNNNIDFIEYYGTSFTNPFYGQYAGENGMLTKSTYRRLNYTFQQLINWGRKFGAHNIGVLLGHETYWRKTYQVAASRSNMFDPGNMELANMITVKNANSSKVDYNNEGYFMRAQYDYDNKYFASASFRRDASSRFHPKHRWGNFWSASAAWLLNKETFLEDQTWINMLKLKVSYGEQGNDNISDWLYTNTYSVENSNGEVSVVPVNMGNENITWEKNGNFNAGVEFSFFGDRLSGSVEGFHRKTSDMLFYFPLPPSMGYTGYYSNIGDMANSGVEIDLHGTPIDTKDFSWTVDFNLTWYKNRISRLPEERRTVWCDGKRGFSSGSYFYGEGESMYTYRMYKYAGVDQETGQSLWWKDVYQLDESGTPVKDAYDQPIVIGKEKTAKVSEATYYLNGTALAPVYGGFGTSLRYKWFDFSINFDYQIGGQCYDSTYAGLMSSPYQNSIGSNIHADILNAWTPENPNSNIPRFQFGDQYNATASDRFLTNASYLSLQNIVFGFTLPDDLAHKAHLNKVRLYLNCDNVWLWSKRQGLDPRLSMSGGGNNTYYSPIRTISGGINVTF